MTLTAIKWTGLAGAAVALAAGIAAASPRGDPLAELAAAREAAHRGQLRALETWRQNHPGHLLEAYAEYWILSGSLERHDPAQVRAFLARHAQTPLAESLRREWLKVLGAAGQWEAFRAEQPHFAGEDGDITCYSFQERLARGDAEVAVEARSLFLVGRELSPACDPVVASLAGAQAITQADVAARLRKLLLASLVREAKRANALTAARNRVNEKLLDQVAADPARFLARHAKSALLTHNERELALFALAKLARTKPEEAAAHLAAFASRLGPEAAAQAWAAVAYQGALVHHPRALDWYAQAGDAVVGDAQVAWRARAGLRAGAWRETLAAIQQMRPEEAREPGWRYWRARALAALGEAEASRALLLGVARERNFYGLLAAEDLGLVESPDWNGWKPQSADLERVGAIPALQRSLALYGLRYDAEALREWFWATRAMDDRDLLCAAELARAAGRSERAINTANRTLQLHDLAQRFPTPHREAVGSAARQWGLDEALMFSIIRQESRFMPEARSRVGATGLMQLMPATASWVARQIPVKPYRADMLTQPEINVQMGTYYFGRVLGDLGHPVLATAAYNAGPGRARRWRDERALEGAIYIETIPFNETRDYVKQVLVNAWFYHHRLTGQVASLKQLIGTVPGREDSQAAVASSRSTLSP